MLNSKCGRPNLVEGLYAEREDVCDVVEVVEVLCHQLLQPTAVQVVGLGHEALVQLNDVVAHEPDQVGEVGCCSLVADVLQHRRIVHCGRGAAHMTSCDTHKYVECVRILIQCYNWCSAPYYAT